MKGIIIGGMVQANEPTRSWCVDYAFDDIINCIGDHYFDGLFWLFRGLNHQNPCDVAGDEY